MLCIKLYIVFRYVETFQETFLQFFTEIRKLLRVSDMGQSPFLFHRESELAENLPQCVVMPMGIGHQVGAAKVYGIRFR